MAYTQTLNAVLSNRIALLQRLFAAAPAILSTILGVMIILKALVDFDMTWDNLAYHLPLSGLRGGVFDENQYRPSAGIYNNYYGFPQAFYYVKGWLWRLTDRPETPQVLTVASIVTLSAFIHWLYKAPVAWTFLGLLAIPVVHDAIVSNYADVPANAFLTIALFGLCDSFINPDKFDAKRLAAIMAAMLCAAHIKPQMAVQLSIVLGVYGTVVLYTLRRGTGGPGINDIIRKHPKAFAAGLAIFLFVAYSVQIKNLIVWGNPIFPVQFAIGSKVIFSGPFGPMSDGPIYSVHFPQFYRWLLSVLEYRAFDLRPIPYIIDQGDVPYTAMSTRVGGYMGIAVLMTVCMFATAVFIRRDRTAWTFAAVWGAITLIIPHFPASHHLRYYMYWMEFGVIATLIMLNVRDSALARERMFYRGFMLSVLAWIILVTGGTYLVPRKLNAVAHAKGFESALEQTVKAGDVLCVENGAQFSFLYAPIFHKELATKRPYSIKQNEEVGGCKGYKVVARP